jgi:hypothetical protein
MKREILSFKLGRKIDDELPNRFQINYGPMYRKKKKYEHKLARTYAKRSIKDSKNLE